MNLTAEDLLQSIWAALRRIEDNMALPPAPLELPAPTIHVAPPDLADIVTAVTSLKPGPTAEEIASAIASVLSAPSWPGTGQEALEAVAQALKNLDFRLKGMGTQAYGGGAVTLEAGQTVAVTGALTNGQLRASPVPVSGFPTTQVVTDDNVGFEAQHTTLTAGTDTTITFAQPVRVVRLSNFDTTNRVLVKNGAITTNTDAAAARVGIAPTANVPGEDYFPYITTTIHLRSAGASEVTVVGFF